ncbi:hypothetical protein Hdeb2414_s0021g00579061 [Helianthus debilis subsp. tardiflorus]
MNELSEALQNITIHTTDMDTTVTFTGCQADIKEPMVFRAQSQEKPKAKKRRRFLGWRRVRRKKPAVHKITKTEDPKDNGKGIEIGESFRQAQGMPSWEELDRKLALSDLIGPADENLFNYPIESLLPVNLEPAIPDPIVNPRPLPGELEEWWTTDWQFQNLINNPNTFFPQFDMEPAPNPRMSNENLAELRHYGEELVDAGNSIRVVGEQIS